MNTFGLGTGVWGEKRLEQLPKLTLTNFDGRNLGPTFPPIKFLFESEISSPYQNLLVLVLVIVPDAFHPIHLGQSLFI